MRLAAAPNGGGRPSQKKTAYPLLDTALGGARFATAAPVNVAGRDTYLARLQFEGLDLTFTLTESKTGFALSKPTLYLPQYGGTPRRTELSLETTPDRPRHFKLQAGELEFEFDLNRVDPSGHYEVPAYTLENLHVDGMPPQIDTTPIPGSQTQRAVSRRLLESGGGGGSSHEMSKTFEFVLDNGDRLVLDLLHNKRTGQISSASLALERLDGSSLSFEGNRGVKLRSGNGSIAFSSSDPAYDVTFYFSEVSDHSTILAEITSIRTEPVLRPVPNFLLYASQSRAPIYRASVPVSHQETPEEFGAADYRFSGASGSIRISGDASDLTTYMSFSISDLSANDRAECVGRLVSVEPAAGSPRTGQLAIEDEQWVVQWDDGHPSTPIQFDEGGMLQNLPALLSPPQALSPSPEAESTRSPPPAPQDGAEDSRLPETPLFIPVIPEEPVILPVADEPAPATSDPSPPAAPNPVDPPLDPPSAADVGSFPGRDLAAIRAWYAEQTGRPPERIRDDLSKAAFIEPQEARETDGAYLYLCGREGASWTFRVSADGQRISLQRTRNQFGDHPEQELTPQEFSGQRIFLTPDPSRLPQPAFYWDSESKRLYDLTGLFFDYYGENLLPRFQRLFSAWPSAKNDPSFERTPYFEALRLTVSDLIIADIHSAMPNQALLFYERAWALANQVDISAVADLQISPAIFSSCRVFIGNLFTKNNEFFSNPETLAEFTTGFYLMAFEQMGWIPPPTLAQEIGKLPADVRRKLGEIPSSWWSLLARSALLEKAPTFEREKDPLKRSDFDAIRTHYRKERPEAPAELIRNCMLHCAKWNPEGTGSRENRYQLSGQASIVITGQGKGCRLEMTQPGRPPTVYHFSAHTIDGKIVFLGSERLENIALYFDPQTRALYELTGNVLLNFYYFDRDETLLSEIARLRSPGDPYDRVRSEELIRMILRYKIHVDLLTTTMPSVQGETNPQLSFENVVQVFRLIDLDLLVEKEKYLSEGWKALVRKIKNGDISKKVLKNAGKCELLFKIAYLRACFDFGIVRRGVYDAEFEKLPNEVRTELNKVYAPLERSAAEPDDESKPSAGAPPPPPPRAAPAPSELANERAGDFTTPQNLTEIRIWYAEHSRRSADLIQGSLDGLRYLDVGASAPGDVPLHIIDESDDAGALSLTLEVNGHPPLQFVSRVFSGCRIFISENPNSVPSLAFYWDATSRRLYDLTGMFFDYYRNPKTAREKFPDLVAAWNENKHGVPALRARHEESFRLALFDLIRLDVDAVDPALSPSFQAQAWALANRMDLSEVASHKTPHRLAKQADKFLQEALATRRNPEDKLKLLEGFYLRAYAELDWIPYNQDLLLEFEALAPEGSTLKKAPSHWWANYRALIMEGQEGFERDRDPLKRSDFEAIWAFYSDRFPQAPVPLVQDCVARCGYWRALGDAQNGFRVDLSYKNFATIQKTGEAYRIQLGGALVDNAPDEKVLTPVSVGSHTLYLGTGSLEGIALYWDPNANTLYELTGILGILCTGDRRVTGLLNNLTPQVEGRRGIYTPERARALAGMAVRHEIYTELRDVRGRLAGRINSRDLVLGNIADVFRHLDMDLLAAKAGLGEGIWGPLVRAVTKRLISETVLQNARHCEALFRIFALRTYFNSGIVQRDVYDSEFAKLPDEVRTELNKIYAPLERSADEPEESKPSGAPPTPPPGAAPDGARADRDPRLAELESGIRDMIAKRYPTFTIGEALERDLAAILRRIDFARAPNVSTAMIVGSFDLFLEGLRSYIKPKQRDGEWFKGILLRVLYEFQLLPGHFLRDPNYRKFSAEARRVLAETKFTAESRPGPNLPQPDGASPPSIPPPPAPDLSNDARGTSSIDFDAIRRWYVETAQGDGALIGSNLSEAPYIEKSQSTKWGERLYFFGPQDDRWAVKVSQNGQEISIQNWSEPRARGEAERQWLKMPAHDIAGQRVFLKGGGLAYATWPLFYFDPHTERLHDLSGIFFDYLKYDTHKRLADLQRGWSAVQSAGPLERARYEFLFRETLQDLVFGTIRFCIPDIPQNFLPHAMEVAREIDLQIVGMAQGGFRRLPQSLAEELIKKATPFHSDPEKEVAFFKGFCFRRFSALGRIPQGVSDQRIALLPRDVQNSLSQISEALFREPEAGSTSPAQSPTPQSSLPTPTASPAADPHPPFSAAPLPPPPPSPPALLPSAPEAPVLRFGDPLYAASLPAAQGAHVFQVSPGYFGDERWTRVSLFPTEGGDPRFSVRFRESDDQALELVWNESAGVQRISHSDGPFILHSPDGQWGMLLHLDAMGFISISSVDLKQERFAIESLRFKPRDWTPEYIDTRRLGNAVEAPLIRAVRSEVFTFSELGNGQRQTPAHLYPTGDARAQWANPNSGNDWNFEFSQGDHVMAIPLRFNLETRLWEPKIDREGRVAVCQDGIERLCAASLHPNRQGVWTIHLDRRELPWVLDPTYFNESANHGGHGRPLPVLWHRLSTEETISKERDAVATAMRERGLLPPIARHTLKTSERDFELSFQFGSATYSIPMRWVTRRNIETGEEHLDPMVQLRLVVPRDAAVRRDTNGEMRSVPVLYYQAAGQGLVPSLEVDGQVLELYLPSGSGSSQLEARPVSRGMAGLHLSARQMRHLRIEGGGAASARLFVDVSHERFDTVAQRSIGGEGPRRFYRWIYDSISAQTYELVLSARRSPGSDAIAVSLENIFSLDGVGTAALRPVPVGVQYLEREEEGGKRRIYFQTRDGHYASFSVDPGMWIAVSSHGQVIPEALLQSPNWKPINPSIPFSASQEIEAHEQSALYYANADNRKAAEAYVAQWAGIDPSLLWDMAENIYPRGMQFRQDTSEQDRSLREYKRGLWRIALHYSGKRLSLAASQRPVFRFNGESVPYTTTEFHGRPYFCLQGKFRGVVFYGHNPENRLGVFALTELTDAIYRERLEQAILSESTPLTQRPRTSEWTYPSSARDPKTNEAMNGAARNEARLTFFQTSFSRSFWENLTQEEKERLAEKVFPNPETFRWESFRPDPVDAAQKLYELYGSGDPDALAIVDALAVDLLDTPSADLQERFSEGVLRHYRNAPLRALLVATAPLWADEVPLAEKVAVFWGLGRLHARQVASLQGDEASPSDWDTWREAVFEQLPSADQLALEVSIQSALPEQAPPLPLMMRSAELFSSATPSHPARVWVAPFNWQRAKEERYRAAIQAPGFMEAIQAKDADDLAAWLEHMTDGLSEHSDSIQNAIRTLASLESQNQWPSLFAFLFDEISEPHAPSGLPITAPATPSGALRPSALPMGRSVH